MCLIIIDTCSDMWIFIELSCLETKNKHNKIIILVFKFSRHPCESSQHSYSHYAKHSQLQGLSLPSTCCMVTPYFPLTKQNQLLSYSPLSSTRSSCQVTPSSLLRHALSSFHKTIFSEPCVPLVRLTTEASVSYYHMHLL